MFQCTGGSNRSRKSIPNGRCCVAEGTVYELQFVSRYEYWVAVGNCVTGDLDEVRGHSAVRPGNMATWQVRRLQFRLYRADTHRQTRMNALFPRLSSAWVINVRLRLFLYGDKYYVYSSCYCAWVCGVKRKRPTRHIIGHFEGESFWELYLVTSSTVAEKPRDGPYQKYSYA